jgi:hypothetical protein
MLVMKKKKKKRDTARKAPAKVTESKVAMSYRLSPARIARARKILGTSSATATIEQALDLVVFRGELNEGLDRAFGIAIEEAFPDSTGRRRR